MDKKTVYNLVKSIQPIDTLEKEHKEDVLRWIESGVELCRLEKPATPPKHLVSYCLLLDVNRQLVLLVDHKKALLWLPAGGHVDPGEHPNDTAVRELKEELGITLPFLQPAPLFLTVTETVGTTVKHVDVSLWYVFLADSSVNYSYDQIEFNNIQWFSLNNLPLERTDPHMSRFCKKLVKSFAEQ